MKVRDIMIRKLASIRPEASVMDAIQKMVSEHVTSLLIEGETLADYGIITRRDIITKVLAEGRNPYKTTVSETMTVGLIMIGADDEISKAALLMAKTGLRRFPVIEGNKVVGLVSNSDILKASLKKIDEKS